VKLQKPVRSPNKRAILSPEPLEDRTVPAGNVMAFVDGGVLHIWGDSADNRIWVSGAGKDTAVITTLDGTTLNGARTQLWFTGIQFAYDIQLHDGNDFLYVSGLDGSAGLFVQMGDGNDGLAVDHVRLDGANVLYTGSGDDTVSIGGGKMKWAAFDTGAGDDRLLIYGTEFGDVVFAGGPGSSDSLGLLSIKWNSFPGTAGFESVFSTLLPVANNDSATVALGQSVTINVLANDRALLGILDPSTVEITSQPKHGIVKVNDNGTVTYTSSNLSTARLDSFRYTVRSSTGAVSNEATVTLVIPDTVGPTPAITTTATDPSNAATIPFKVTFNEKVTGFDVSDVSVTNGTVSNFAADSTNPRVFTFDVTPTADGTVTVNIAAAAAKDNAGNDSIAASKSIVSDRTQPGTTISSSATNPTNQSPIPVTVTFTEPVLNFIATDVTVTNGTISNFLGTGATYTFNVTPTANGTVTVDVAGGVANDAAGNANTAATQFTIGFDTGAPSVTLNTTATSPTNLTTIPFTATFSESVTGFTAADIGVTNGTVSNFQGSGANYTFDVTPTADGAVTVSIAAGVANDSGNNGNTAATPVTLTSDTTPPTATVSSSESGTTSLNPIPFTVTFSEAVTGFTAGDVLVANGSVINFAGSGANYTFDVVPSGNNVQVDVSVPAGVAEDAAANGNTVSNTYTITFSGSTVSATITTTATDPTNLSPIPMTVTFGENVTGFDLADISVTNGTASNVQGSGSTYTFDVTPAGDGPVVVNIAGGAATGDVSSNPTSAAQFTITSDSTQPSATISTSATSPTNSSPIPFTLTFSENVTGLTLGEIIVTNGTPSNLQGSGTTYTFDVTPTADGDVTVSVAVGVAQDLAGNDNTAATPVTIVSDTTNPAVTIADSASGAITGTSSDTSGVTGVQISINNGSGFWNGTDFSGASEQFFAATSGDNFATWSFAFAPGGPFIVHAQATDAAGNVGESTNNAVTVT